MTHWNKTAHDEVNRQIESAFARHKRGDVDFASGVYRQVLARHPDQPLALHYLGLATQQTGRSQEALRLLQRSIEIDPTDPRAHNHLGQIYVALNDKRNAAICFERALEIDPNHVASLNNLANVTMTRDLRQAIAIYRRALTLSPDAAFAVYNLAQALNEDNAFDEALLLYRRVLALDPRHLQARHRLGVLLEQRGQFPEAIEQYLTVQQLDSRHVSSLANVIGLREYVPDLSMVHRAEDLLKARGASDEDRIKLHRGLGKHYERAGEYEPAFAHFAGAKNLLRRSKAPFQIESVLRSMDRLRATFTDEFFRQRREICSNSKRLVFIVGLPRSGTTLTEQILASHPQVFGAGEMQEIPQLVKLLRPEYPECTKTMDAAALTELARDYVSVIERLSGPSALRITDKMPLNSLHLGLIATLFPEAHIVYCRRDPRDIAISCFVELFDLEQDYTTSFEDFGRYFLAHEQLMAHWHSVIPIPIHDLQYEALIDDPEATSRALIAYCGLEWDPACLAFHQTERTVQTPSRWQVRQPIYRTSVGRWRHYLPHMTELLRVLDAGEGADEHVFPQTRETAPVTADDASNRITNENGRRWNTVPASLDKSLFIVAAPRSGSTLLFETLARSNHICTVGGEAHWLVENFEDLRPGARGVDSNRLMASQATDTYRAGIIGQIVDRLVDNTGVAVNPDGDRVFLEKTPKNALRIPFFNRIFPRARFVFLWRDPRENISSIMEAWRSGRFITYKELSGFGGPWSLLLPPGYQGWRNRPLEEIAAFQWECANRIIMDDLELLEPGRSLTVSYGNLIADPAGTVARVTEFAGIPIDSALRSHLQSPLPPSRYTQSAPSPEKWRINEAEIARVLPVVEHTLQRLRNLA